MTKEIFYVTGNDGKFEEVATFITENVPSVKVTQARLDLDEMQTTDQQSIAITKAHHAWNELKKPVLVDDAGVYFEKYQKFPGTMTKFLYYGIGMDGILKLFEQGDKAYFLLYLVYMDGQDSYQVFEGRCNGHLIVPEQFSARPDLPFDDIFLPEGSDKTYAQMRFTPEMNEYFYRLRALKKFLEWYQHGS